MKFPWFKKKRKTQFVTLAQKPTVLETQPTVSDPFKVIMIEWSYYKGPVVKNLPVEVWSYDLSDEIVAELRKNGVADRSGGGETAGGGRHYEVKR